MSKTSQRIKRCVTLVAGTFALILFAAGCGGGTDAVDKPAETRESAPAQAPPEIAPQPLAPPNPQPRRLEVVGRFTTRYPCCQPRVTNIKRAVEILDGQRIAPSATFSMNAALGERTTGRGFVPAPMISGGVMVDSIGGGISQVATTLYNAAFLAGLELIEHSPHSIYIDRYPMGREATISWGGPELIFRNDWNAPIRIDARATNSFVRVRLLSLSLGRRIVTKTEPPHSYVAPRTIFIQNTTLAPGTQRVRQSAGSPGFDVTYMRRVYVWSSLRSRETFRVRYQPQNAVIEVGPPRSHG